MTSTTIGTSELKLATGVTDRQINWWCAHGVLALDHDVSGTGSRRRYSMNDVTVVRALVRVQDAGRFSMEDLEVVADTAYRAIEMRSSSFVIDFGNGVTMEIEL